MSYKITQANDSYNDDDDDDDDDDDVDDVVIRVPEMC